MINAQEIFDTVAKHLAAQGRPARKNAPTKVCVYRAPGGLKCAPRQFRAGRALAA